MASGDPTPTELCFRFTVGADDLKAWAEGLGLPWEPPAEDSLRLINGFQLIRQLAIASVGEVWEAISWRRDCCGQRCALKLLDRHELRRDKRYRRGGLGMVRWFPREEGYERSLDIMRGLRVDHCVELHGAFGDLSLLEAEDAAALATASDEAAVAMATTFVDENLVDLRKGPVSVDVETLGFSMTLASGGPVMVPAERGTAARFVPPGEEAAGEAAANTGIPAREAATCMRHLCTALEGLHSLGIAHGDVKPSNLVWRSPGDCMLVDLGSSRRIADGCFRRHDTWDATPLFMAPEMWTAADSEAGYDARKVDLYAAGVTLWCLLGGSPPFQAPRECCERPLEGIEAPAPRAGTSEQEASAAAQLRELALLLLNPEPSLRPSAAEALQHPSLAQSQWLESNAGQQRRDG